MKRLVAAAALWSIALGVAIEGRAQEPTKEFASARMTTYEKSTGEIYFALSLRADTPKPPAKTTDLVVLFDTSASQVGLYRDDSFNCLRRLVEGLEDGDRVQIFALDLQAKPMHDSLAAPEGPSIAGAIEALKKRTPLGSTDLPLGLQKALEVLKNDRKTNKNIVYIGDGVSRANFIGVKEMEELVKKLRANQTAVSSFAIGPQRDVELLAALANHTGGTLLMDVEGSDAAVRAGADLSRAAKTAILWPQDVDLGEAVLVHYPELIPPIRMDRDSILVGMLKSRGEHKITFKAVRGEDEETLGWTLKPEPSSGEFGFLPKLVEVAAKDGGVRLPTIGSEGLREVGRIILNDARTLLKLGTQALKRSDFKAAARAAQSVLDRDPDNPEAHALKRAAARGLRRQEAKAKQEKKPDEGEPSESSGDGAKN